MNSAWDFLLTLGLYWMERLKDAGVKMASGFNPWNAKTFFAGLCGLVYLIAVVVFTLVLLCDGFGAKSVRNFRILIALCVVFALSLMK